MTDRIVHSCVRCALPLTKKPGPGRWPRYCDVCRRLKSRASSARRWDTYKATHPRPTRTPGRTFEPRECGSCGEWFTQHPLPKVGRTRVNCYECSPFRPGPQIARRHRGVDRSCTHCGAVFTGYLELCVRCREYQRRHGTVPPLGRRCEMCDIAIDDRPLNATICASTRCRNKRTNLYRARGEAADPVRAAVAKAKKRASNAKRRGKPQRYTEAKRASDQRRRARKRGSPIGEPFTTAEIGERDGWRCQLCRKRINRGLLWPHPMSVTLDHIVPLAKDGPHTRENVQIAHATCNIAKNDGLTADGQQLRLIG